MKVLVNTEMVEEKKRREHKNLQKSEPATKQGAFRRKKLSTVPSMVSWKNKYANEGDLPKYIMPPKRQFLWDKSGYAEHLSEQ